MRKLEEIWVDLTPKEFYESELDKDRGNRCLDMKTSSSVVNSS